jgi:indolepyruvate ferredoxin oxidoreductase
LQVLGFSRVKLAKLALARARAVAWLHRFDPTRLPRPAPSRAAGRIRGVALAVAAG